MRIAGGAGIPADANPLLVVKSTIYSIYIVTLAFY